MQPRIKQQDTEIYVINEHFSLYFVLNILVIAFLGRKAINFLVTKTPKLNVIKKSTVTTVAKSSFQQE